MAGDQEKTTTMRKQPLVQSLHPNAYRVHDEASALLRGVTFQVVILVVLVLLALPILRIPFPANVTALVLLAAWYCWPYLWLLLRAARQTRAQTSSIFVEKSSTLRSTVKQEMRLQQVLNDQMHAIHRAERLLVLLVPGDAAVYPLLHPVTHRENPQRDQHLRIADGLILLTGKLYEHTPASDQDMLVLHQLGHIAARHLRLLSVADVLPGEEIDLWLKILLLPALPFIATLREWQQWAEVSADRFMYLLRPDYDLAVRSILKQTLLRHCQADGFDRLAHYLDTGTSPDDHGERMSLQSEIGKFLLAYPDADLRINNLKEWHTSEAYEQAKQSLAS